MATLLHRNKAETTDHDVEAAPPPHIQHGEKWAEKYYALEESKFANIGKQSTDYLPPGSFKDRLIDRIYLIFGTDYRSLAIFRFFIGFLGICDLIVRSFYLKAHYANLGVWPIGQAVNWGGLYLGSLHYIHGHVYFQAFIFIIHGVICFLMMVGYRTRLTTFLSWLFLISLHNRNGLILNGGDDYWRVVLFWSLFIPLGKVYSIDRALKDMRKDAQPRTLRSEHSTPETTNPHHQLRKKYYLSFGTVGFMVQVLCVYVVSGFLKTGEDWKNGTAVYYALMVDQFTLPLGYLLLRFPRLMTFLSHMTLIAEKWLFFLWFSPWGIPYLKIAGAVIISMLHTGFGLCMSLGFFVIIPHFIVATQLPAWLWDSVVTPRVRGKWLRECRMLRLHYTTGIARLAAYITRTFLLFPDTPLVAATPTADVDHAHWLAVEDAAGHRYYREHSVLAILRHSPYLYPVSWLLRFRSVRAAVAIVYQALCYVALVVIDNAYDETDPAVCPATFAASLKAPSSATLSDMAAVSGPVGDATNGVSTSTIEGVLKARRGSSRRRGRIYQIWKRYRIGRVAVEMVACFLVWYIIRWNLASLKWLPPMPRSLYPIAPLLRIDQGWAMFAPNPMKGDGWFVIPAVLKNGTEFDLFRKGYPPVDYSKPRYVAYTYHTQRWRKFMMNLFDPAHEDKRLYYGQWLCREWNWSGKHKGDEQLDRFQIIYMREYTLPDYKVDGPVPIVLWNHKC